MAGVLLSIAEVHVALSETMRELGITAEIDQSGHYDSVRSRLTALDRATQARQIAKLGAAPDYIVGSAHAVTDAGEIIVGSGSGSQLGAYAYAAGHVILAIGHQKLVPDLGEGLRRVREYSLPREHARMQSAGRAGSMLTKTLIIHSEQDWRCPVEQAQRLYVALKMRGVDTELLLFPGEGHELSRSGLPSHRVARFDAILDWWSRHLA